MEILPFVSFFTGVISILSPCILPIIPIFVAFGLKSKSKGEIVSFILGFISVFALIIVLTGFFTSLIFSYMFYVRILAAILLLAIGILMLTGYSFNFAVKLPKSSDGFAGSFALGLITSISWAPCYGAYLISLITLLVSSNSAMYAVLNLILYCAGFGMTLFVLGFALSRINMERMLSKAEYFPKIFAVLIIAGAVYLLWESFKVLV